MTAFVIDASVAIKWVVGEAGSEEAVRLIEGPTLSAPDLLMSECANILWKKTRRGELLRDEAILAIELLVRANIELVPTRGLAAAATTLSLDLDHSAYDCLYMALTLQRGDVFVTADSRFIALVRSRGASYLHNRVVDLARVEDLLH